MFRSRSSTRGRGKQRRTDEIVQRIEQVAQESGAQLESALKSKADFAQDVAKLEQDRTQLGDFMRRYLERLAAERKGLDTLDQRVQALQAGCTTVEKSVDGLAVTDRAVTGLTQKVGGLDKQVHGLLSQTDELQKKQAGLDTLQDRLAQVDELSKRTGWQFRYP